MAQRSGFQFDHSYLQLPTCFYTRQKPTKAVAPKQVLFNAALAKQLGLDFSHLNIQQTAALFAGNVLLHDAAYYAQAYAGHQYAHFTMLGDGRALVWGEHITPSGNRVDLQFKGSGRTAYSRGGDGKATLAPMLREYIISEAMHHLGIATTRSLAVVTTGEQIMREEMLPGAILTRVASSHLRIGTFEFASMQQDSHVLEALLDYSIARHYPHLKNSKHEALDFLQAVMQRQIDLIVEWMRVGFIHGVMNTDNMTLSGEAIDYGPCAFMDNYDPTTVFSSIDKQGRYAYQNQAPIAQWNLARLAEALLPLIAQDTKEAVALAESVIHTFPHAYQTKWLTMMCAKLGLRHESGGQAKLVSDLLQWMQDHHADYTNTFTDLGQAHQPQADIYQNETFMAWYQRWQVCKPDFTLMQSNNPIVIARNHQVEEVLQRALHANDYQPLHDLLAVLKAPYNRDDSNQAYRQPPKPSQRVYQTFCGT